MAQDFWKRARQRFRVSVMNEDTLGEVWHFRLSKMGMLLWLLLGFLLTFSLLALLVWLTPLRNYLPGYNANIRKDLVTEIARVDSLQQNMSLQNEYLGIIRNLVSGEVASDSVQPLDSLVIRQKAKLLETQSELTAEFIAQYEEKEKDQLTLFDATTTTPLYTLFRPTRGVIVEHFMSQSDYKGIAIRTSEKSSINAVLAGSIVYITQSFENGWVIVMQHEGDYLSVYRNTDRPLKKIGDTVDAGEAIATIGDEQLLLFELWQKGVAQNPEEVIAF